MTLKHELDAMAYISKLEKELDECRKELALEEQVGKDKDLAFDALEMQLSKMERDLAKAKGESNE